MIEISLSEARRLPAVLLTTARQSLIVITHEAAPLAVIMPLHTYAAAVSPTKPP